MNSQQSRRTLANLKLTRKHHFTYLGLWILMTMALIIALNVVLYLYAEERWGGVYSLDSAFHSLYVSHRVTFVTALFTEAALLIAAIVMLARLTAHRIAGVFIRLQQTFKSVQEGNVEQPLKFRKYDKLEDLEEAFNDMMTALRTKMGEGAG
jgi:methyl-accepting chemotaxis protein